MDTNSFRATATHYISTILNVMCIQAYTHIYINSISTHKSNTERERERNRERRERERERGEREYSHKSGYYLEFIQRLHSGCKLELVYINSKGRFPALFKCGREVSE